MHALLICMQLLASGSDAYLTNRNAQYHGWQEHEPLSHPFVMGGSIERAGYFAVTAGLSVGIAELLDRHNHHPLALGLRAGQIAENGLSVQPIAPPTECLALIFALELSKAFRQTRMRSGVSIYTRNQRPHQMRARQYSSIRPMDWLCLLDSLLVFPFRGAIPFSDAPSWSPSMPSMATLHLYEISSVGGVTDRGDLGAPTTSAPAIFAEIPHNSHLLLPGATGYVYVLTLSSNTLATETLSAGAAISIAFLDGSRRCLDPKLQQFPGIGTGRLHHMAQY